jgi:hypothetical protein
MDDNQLINADAADQRGSRRMACYDFRAMIMKIWKRDP